MASGEGHFVDANLLVYAALKDDMRHAVCRKLLTDAEEGVLLYISPQILVEFYSAITSPKRVTAPFEPLEAVEFIERLLEFKHIVVLPVGAEVPAR